MDTLSLLPGTIVHVYGMPVRLVGPVMVEGRKENFQTEEVRSPEYSGAWHRVLGPISPTGGGGGHG